MASVTHSWSVIAPILKEHASKAYRALRRPASDTVIARLQKSFPVRIPAPFIASLRIHNGMREGPDFINFMRLLGVADILEWLSVQRDVQSLHDFDGPETGSRRIRTDKRWREKWLPIMVDAGGNLVVMDLEPGPSGKRGQIFGWRNYGGPNRVLADSYAAWLGGVATELSKGRFEVDEFGDIQLKKKLA